jgi:uncharacterized protein
MKSKSRALLDVNVLIALLDGAHIHHQLAWAWWSQQQARGWSSCPLTQNGCIRVMSQPSYPGALPAAEVAQRLAEACAHASHVFWPADADLLQAGLIHWPRILGHRQVTDAYLLALAVRHGGCLVSFDRRIDLGCVTGARAQHLEVLSAASV